MIVRQNGLRYEIEGLRYRLRTREDQTVELSVDGCAFADLRALSSVSGPGDTADTSGDLQGPEVRRDGDAVFLTWMSSSSLWDRRVCEFECTDSMVSYRVTVEGQGAVGAVEYFDGGGCGPASLFRFSRYMTAEVSMLDQRYYQAWSYGCIDATSGGTGPFSREPEDNNHWLFTPPPFTYSWGNHEGPWLGVGAAPEPGQYNFTRFQYWPIGNCFKLRLTYDGMTQVSGTWTSPRITLCPADDEYSAMEACVDYLYSSGLCRPYEAEAPEWWSRPIFCGWGEQNITCARDGRSSGQKYATQQHYDRFLALLQERGLKPGTLVIDDKWQAEYGTLEADPGKWPDLRGWIDARHSEDQKVLLWLGMWANEGLSPDECILETASGQHVAADPTSPVYEKRLRAAVRRMLSPDHGCYNADGFKVDWTNGFPLGEGYQTAGGAWGVELLKRLQTIVYEEAKAVKPDALIITHMANPYFAEVTDMLRLNDISAIQRDVVHIMKHRALICRIAHPWCLVDCDNSSMPTAEEWLRYMRIQPELGVPSLYFLTAVDGTGEPIPMEWWDLIPSVWRGR